MAEETTSSSSTDETKSGLDPKAETATQATSETLETTTNQQTPDDISREIERLKASLKRANAEAKQYREQATELSSFKERTETEKLSDNEKREAAQKKLEQQLSEHQSQNSSLLRELQEARITNQVLTHASKLNIVDLDAATKLLDGSRIEYDENGHPTNIPELLKDLVKQRSWLVGKPPVQTSGGATNPSRSQTSAQQEITKEYVQQIQSGGREAWNALSEQERQRIRRFTSQGGLFRR